MRASVSVIVVSYNTRDLLARALASALAHAAAAEDGCRLHVECIVVDNASVDGSADMVEARFPEAILLRSAENRGFAWAVNRGLERASGDLVLLLNPDAELAPGALTRMVEFLLERPRVAAVGPRLLYADGTRQHAAFRFPTLAMIVLDFFPLHGRLLDSRLNGRYPLAASPHRIDHPLGACMLLRRVALEDVGPFDERFFMYCEEVDWCLRAKAKGWEIYHLPDAVAQHVGGQSARQNRDAMYVELHRSRLRLYEKHYGRLFCTLARLVTRLGLWVETRRARASAASGALTEAMLASRLEALDALRRTLGATSPAPHQARHVGPAKR